MASSADVRARLDRLDRRLDAVSKPPEPKPAPKTQGSLLASEYESHGRTGYSKPPLKDDPKYYGYADGRTEARIDPPVSEAQRRAMWAAKSGKSNIGIPKSVGKEFAEADPGGKLPARKNGLLDKIRSDSAVYPGPQREGAVTPDNGDQVRDATWRTTPEASLASSPAAVVDLRESHLSRRAELIRKLGYPSMMRLLDE